MIVADSELKGSIGAILFASPKPVELNKLCSILERRAEDLRVVLDEIAADLDNIHVGVRLSVHGDTYRLCTREKYYETVSLYISKGHAPGLSNAAMEVLAIVAYNQPTTKTYVSQVRGIASADIIESLVDKDLLEAKGRLDLPGRPMSYGTTDKFLTVFGLKSIDELPAKELFSDEISRIQTEDPPLEIYEQPQVYRENDDR